MNINILRRFIIICAVSTFVMFTFWAVYKSFVNRPPGDYETEVCDNRLKDKMWNKAIKAANEALIKNPEHRGAMMCEAIANINKKEYQCYLPFNLIEGLNLEIVIYPIFSRTVLCGNKPKCWNTMLILFRLRSSN